ncbi:hypothetical protein D9M70_548960 [compost metagenome]
MGKVVSLPLTNTVMISSSNESAKTSTEAPKMLGLNMGRVTSRNDCQVVAPRSRAASSRDWSKYSIRDRIVATKNGNAYRMCAMVTLTRERPMPTWANQMIREIPKNNPGRPIGTEQIAAIAAFARPFILIMASATVAPRTVVPIEAAVATMMLFQSEVVNVGLVKICSYQRRLKPSNGNTSEGAL